MGTQHTTKHQHSDGTWTETTTTDYKDGSSKSVTKDITDRTLLNDGKVITVTRTDSDGNSRTEGFKKK